MGWQGRSTYGVPGSLVFVILQPSCAANSEGYAAALMGLCLQKQVIFDIVICLTRAKSRQVSTCSAVGGLPSDSEPVPAKCAASRSQNEILSMLPAFS